MRNFGFWQPALTLAALLMMIFFSNIAIAAPARAPVVVDGRVLFTVGESNHFSARDRAQSINQNLAQAVEQDTMPTITVAQEAGLTVLRADERYLLTVTEADLQAVPWPMAQGRRWQRQIEAALVTAQAQRTWHYRSQAFTLMAGIATAALLGLWGSRRLVKATLPSLSRWLHQPQSRYLDWAQPILVGVRLFAIALQLAMGLTAAYLISDRLPQTRIWRYTLYCAWHEPVITLGDGSAKSIADVVTLGLVAVGLWFLVSGLSRWFKLYLAEQMGQETARFQLLATVLQSMLLLFGLMMLLPLWGINLTSLAIFGSFLGVGLGFGAQNIVNNFVSGLIIAIEQPIKVGDFVTVNDFQGTVTQVGARSTKIRTPDHVTIIVPNSRFLETEVVNRSYDDPISRLHIPVGVAYGSSLKRVRQALLEAATQHPEVLLRPAPQVWFMDFGESALQFELLVWTALPREQPRIKSELNYRIEAKLRQYDIDVPFPQQDLHLRSPQLDAWLEAHLRDRGIPIPTPEVTATDLDFLDPAHNCTTIEQFSSREIEALVAAMRGAQGLNIQDRRYRLSVYPRCFVGSEAVDWLMDYHQCDRGMALAIGQLLSDRGIIHHVTDEHPFQDAFLFYRFYADEVN